MADEKPNTPTAASDPYDMAAKRQLNEKADAKNRIEIIRGGPRLTCGARKTKRGPGIYCKAIAGMGTQHPGWGRCKHCGGASTGPKTAEGKAAVAKNSTIHGLYAAALEEDEAEIYQQLAEQKRLDLEHEIYFLKAKILKYLTHWKGKNKKRRDAASLEDGLMNETWYVAGSMDDRPLLRALETLGRLVEKHARLAPDGGEDLLGQINSELRAASQGKVTVSWGGPAQQRVNQEGGT
jgi:hypothetical protein